MFTLRRNICRYWCLNTLGTVSRPQWIGSTRSVCVPSRGLNTHFIPTSSCVSLPRLTTSSGWKLKSFNPLTAGDAYIWFFIFYQHLKYHLLNMLKIKCDINQQSNSWPPFCQVWIIFTHLKLWIASARHNFKWVKHQIKQFGGQRVNWWH